MTAYNKIKVLIVDSNHQCGTEEKYLQILVGDIENEALYSEFQSIDEETGKITYDTHELAVHVDGIIKIRDYLNRLIEAI